MKYLFAIILIISCLNAAPIKATNRTRLADYFNRFREFHAVELEIANMQELSYDDELEEEGRTFKNCEDVEHGANYRVRMFSGVPRAPGKNESDGFAAIIRPKEFYWESPKFAIIAENLHPLHSRFACVKMDFECPAVVSGDIARAVCLFGMTNSDPRLRWELGEAGTKCPNGKAEGKLCKAVMD